MSEVRISADQFRKSVIRFTFAIRTEQVTSIHHGYNRRRLKKVTETVGCAQLQINCDEAGDLKLLSALAK
jgi:hypothetical protein